MNWPYENEGSRAVKSESYTQELMDGVYSRLDKNLQWKYEREIEADESCINLPNTNLERNKLLRKNTEPIGLHANPKKKLYKQDTV